MKKQIIAASVLSVVIFIFTLWITLPYENFVQKALTQAEKQGGISISFSDISSGPLSTTLEELELNGNPIGTVKLSYSPLKLIMGKVGYRTSGAVNAAGVLSSDDITFKGRVSSGLINGLTDELSITGDLQADIKANPEINKAGFAIFAEKLKLNTPMGPMDFEKVTAEAVLGDNRLTINKLTSEGSMELNLKGTVRFNPKDITRSLVDMSGTFNFLGEQKQLTLKGLADNIQPSIR
jgi:hypothetical protein